MQVVADGRRPGARQADAERAGARARRTARGDGDRRQPHGPRRRLQHRPPTGTTGTDTGSGDATAWVGSGVGELAHPRYFEVGLR